MQQDQDDDEGSVFDDIPSFKEAVKERKERIAELREEGNSERADLLAKCRKGNRCYLNDCPVCDRRRRVEQSKLPDSVIGVFIGSSGDFRFSVLTINVNAIKIKGPHRPLNEQKLRELKASIALIGLQMPITVRIQKKKVELVTGRYRLEAMRQLGAEYIPCFEHYCEEIESYLWRRMENVYRAESRVLERAERINEMQRGGKLHPLAAVSRIIRASRWPLGCLVSRRRKFAARRSSRR